MDLSRKEKTTQFVRTAKRLLKFNKETTGVMFIGYKISGKMFTGPQLETIIHRHLIDLGVRPSAFEMAAELELPTLKDNHWTKPIIVDIQNGFSNSNYLIKNWFGD